MDGVATEDLLLATLVTEIDMDGGVALSTVVDSILGSSQRLSHHVEMAVAVETLIEHGQLRRETSGDTDVLSLTEEGSASAAATAEELSEQEIELVDGDTRRTTTVGQAAETLGRSLASIVRNCTADGVYYRQERTDGEGLVGRSEQRAQFRAVLDRVQRTGNGETIRLVGAGGNGKTTFTAVVGSDTPETVDVCRVSSSAADTEPYQPIRDLLAQLEAVDVFSTPTLQVDDTERYETQQTGLFNEITAQLTPESGIRVLVFDDVNHADAGTWEYLGFLCRRLGDRPLVVVFSHRPGTLPEESPIHPTAPISETAIELSGLDRAETRELVEQLLDFRGVPAAFVDAIHERTGGAPLFVEATIETLLDTHQLDPQIELYPTAPDEIELPAAVTETIQHQATFLEPAVRAVLEWVAVADSFVPVTLLQQAADYPPQRVRTILDTLAQMGLLQKEMRADETEIAFSNEVVGDALADGLADADRTDRHETIAHLLEQRAHERDSSAQRPTVDRAATIAYHYEQSGNRENAIEWYDEAADRATDIYAHETAIEYYYRVIEIARQAELSDTVLSANERLAEIYTITGAYDQARKHVQFVRERIDGDSARSQHLAWLAGRIHAARGEYDETIATVTAALEQGHEPTVDQCRLLGVLAEAYDGISDYEEAGKTANRQREQATQLDDPTLEADALFRLGRLARQQGEYQQAHDRYEQCREIYAALDDVHGEATVVNELGSNALKRGAFDQARAHYERSFEMCTEIGDKKGKAENLKGLGAVADRSGDYDQAREYYERALDISTEIGDSEGQARNLNNLGLIATRQGAYETAYEYYQQCLDITSEIGNRRGEAYSLNNLGHIDYVRGAYGRAHDHYNRSLEIKREIGDRDGTVYSLNDLGALARRQGSFDRAREYYERGRDLAQETDLARREAMSLGGLAALSRQQEAYDEADDYFERALVLIDGAGDRTEVGQIRLEGARQALARGNPATASERVESARETFEELDEPLWLGRCRRLLGEIAVETDDLAAARDHFESAVETFDQLDASPDTLRTLECLVESCLAQDEEASAREYYQRARRVLVDAPEPVEDADGRWIEAYADRDGLTA